LENNHFSVEPLPSFLLRSVARSHISPTFA
jgi:hypothetical protein